jgi:G3E family GTPase
MTENTENKKGPLPICIVSGFLGAGKTTLLNNLINGDHDLRMGVLVNDFGAIDIDSKLIVGIDENTISLKSGCICCTMRDDFLKAISKLVRRPNPPEFLLIETSGVSDPGAVVMTLTAPAFAKVFRVETVLTVVDAAELLALSKDQYNLAEAQLFSADIVVINKCDLVNDAELESVKRKVRELSPKARLLQATHGQVPLPIILGEGGEKGGKQPPLFTRGWKIQAADGYGATGPLVRSGGHGRHHRQDGCVKREAHHGDHHKCGQHQHHQCGQHPHHHGGSDSLTSAFQSSSYVCDRPMVLDRLREVLRDLPNSIYRLKGFFHVDAAPDKGLLIQVVGSRISAVEAEPWGDRKPQTEVVAIGERGTIDDRVLALLFDTCIAQGNTASREGLVEKVLFWRRRTKGQSGVKEGRFS